MKSAWRMLGGVLEATLASFRVAPESVTAWLGPAIGPCHFEVGGEVRRAFLACTRPADHAATYAAFSVAPQPGKWLADLYALARIRLQAAGLSSIHGEALCTVCDNDRFYSYRKQPVTGRFATLILRAN
jgi:copper oxidase (laccase) domain-containing protein